MDYHEDHQSGPVTPEPAGFPEPAVTGEADIPAAPEPEIIPEPEVISDTISQPEPIPEPEPAPEPIPEPAPVPEWSAPAQPEQYTVRKKRRKKSGIGKKILAAVLTLALVAGSCAATA